jgi:formate-dependent nitrite reductase membrane component NrfD
MGKNPAWSWYIIWYFFLGGVAAGAYVLAAMADLFGRRDDRRLAGIGYGVALTLVAVCPILLTLDLGMPGRALNMFRVFRPGSPMSVGSWALVGFGLAALFSLILALRDRPDEFPLRRAVAVPGALLGFFVASYTGVLLGATNRPAWAGNEWIGPLFLVSAASTGLAALVLLMAGGEVAGLRRFHLAAIVVEAVLLAVFVRSVGPQAAVVLLGPLAVPFWGGVVLAGLALPLALALRPARPAAQVTAAVLVLLGGFALRYVVLSVGQI